MEKALTFDPVSDLQEVDQLGFFDLREAYASGSIPGSLNVTSDEGFNQASPDSLLHRPDDSFAARRQRDYVRAALAAKSVSGGES